MRLFLTVLSPSGTYTAETDHAMVEERGIHGALQFLKDEAFGRMPPVDPAACDLRFSFQGSPGAP